MGIDLHTARFLLAAKGRGVSFQKTLTIGRQGFAPDHSGLQRLFARNAVSQTALEAISKGNGYADEFFRVLGAQEVTSIDNSNYEGATVVSDMNNPIDRGLRNRFTAIFDGGCLEHIFNFPRAMQNCMEMLCVGGHFMAVTPANNFCGHGFYQFSPELFFRIFSQENGFSLQAALLLQGKNWYEVSDPAKIGARVELTNARPAYLYILARKSADQPIFQTFPQQSDYLSEWNRYGDGGDALGQDTRGPRIALRSRVPIKVKEFLRPVWSLLPLGLRSKCFRRVNKDMLLSSCAKQNECDLSESSPEK